MAICHHRLAGVVVYGRPAAGSETFPRADHPGFSNELPIREEPMSVGGTKIAGLPQSAAQGQPDMRRYFEKPEDQLSIIMEADPVCLYLETTNRCNLLCTTCPRTFETLEPEMDMSWELFTSIIDQYPKIARVVLHGIGEPMLVKD